MSNSRFKALTAIGPDRTGLVRAISQMIHNAGCNLEDSRMAILGGEFALILLFSGTPEQLASVEAETESLGESLGLTVLVRDTAAPADSGPVYLLRAEGHDQSGIVDAVSSVLSDHDVSVIAFESHVTPAPHSGTPMFRLAARVVLPSELTAAALRETLGSVAKEHHLHLSVEADS